mmetsp:Transcript_144612/g.252084  ORF Transcript_144612/g.252084 Transcript_144612/m.252084 type:complete len:442 (-) Transcript_144612:109-1434(-)
MGTKAGESYLYDLSLIAKTEAAASPKRSIKASKLLKGGQVVYIVQGDLTQEKVGAIVNAANGLLQHDAGLARAICNAGGNVIQEECDTYINTYKQVKTGRVVWTRAGDLPCKWVLHAVGPIWMGGSNQEPELLEECIYNCLTAADEKKVDSISIPAVSSGIFGFPKKLCAQIILRTVYDYFWTNKSGIKKVSLTNTDDETVDIFMMVFKDGYATWGQPAPSKLKVEYSVSDITQVVARSPQFLLHAVAVGRKWSDKGIMGKLVKVHGPSAKAQYEAQTHHDLGSVLMVPLADPKKDDSHLTLCHLYVLTKAKCELDLDALKLALKKVSEAAKKVSATLHVEKLHSTSPAQWAEVHALLLETFASHPHVFVHTNSPLDLKKYNAAGGPASPSASSSSAPATGAPSKRLKRLPSASDRKFCWECGAQLEGSRRFCSDCGERQE